MSAQAQIILAFDRLAKIRQSCKITTGTDFWHLSDAAEDTVYENRVSNQLMTNLDTAVADAAFGNETNWRNFFNLHTTYFGNPTTSGEPGLGYTSDTWNSYFDAVRYRMPYECAEAFYEATGLRLDPQFVSAKGTWAADIADNATAGLHKFGDTTRATTWPATMSNGSGLLPVTIQGAPVIIVSNAGAGATSLTVNCTTQDRTTPAAKAIAMTGLTLGTDDQYIVGEQAVGAAGAAAGQKVVPAVATGQFTALDWVLITESGVGEEVCQVASLVTNTSLTMVDNLVNTFTSGGKIWPLFVNVTGISAVTGGTDADAIQVYARPDHAIAL